MCVPCMETGVCNIIPLEVILKRLLHTAMKSSNFKCIDSMMQIYPMTVIRLIKKLDYYLAYSQFKAGSSQHYEW